MKPPSPRRGGPYWPSQDSDQSRCRIAESGRLDEARARFERAIELEPTNAKARLNLGNVLHGRGEYQAALILYRDAAALDPEFADAHFNLALTCEQLERVEEARRHWQRYLDPAGELAAIAREHLAGSAL